MKHFTLVGTVLLLLLLLAACDVATLGVRDGGELGVYISCPGITGTRDVEGEVPGSDPENAVHSLLVWVFNSTTHELVGSLDLTGSELPMPGRVRRYDLSVTRDFARVKPDVDVFAVANAASIGCTLTADSSWEEIDTVVFRNPYFGVTEPVVRSVDPALGLPMSGVGRGLKVENEEPMLRVETIELQRAVSKVRFVFCRMKTDEQVQQDSIRIEKVTLKEGMIPVGEYLFPASPADATAIAPGGYEPTPLVTFGPDWIARNETPEKLVYAGQDPVSYEKLIDQAVSDGVLSDWGAAYLRESDKLLTGYVDYVVNGESNTRSFSMSASGDFARNHNWTVYGYFLSGRNLQLSIRALPWDYNTRNINFSEIAIVAQPLTVDDTTAEVTETSHEHYNVRLRAGTSAKCRLFITSPKSAKLLIRPVGDANAFIVEPQRVDINPDYKSGAVDIEIRRNPDALGNLSGKYITLSFSVSLGEREINADSEILFGKEYRFIL